MMAWGLWSASEAGIWTPELWLHRPTVAWPGERPDSPKHIEQGNVEMDMRGKCLIMRNLQKEGENFFFNTYLLFSFFLRASSSPTNSLCLFKCCSWDWQWVSVGVYSPWVLVNKATVNPKSTNVNPHAGGCAQVGGSYKPWLNWWSQSLNQWCAGKGKQWALRVGNPDVVASEDFHGVNTRIKANFKLPFFITALKIPDDLKISSFKPVWASNKTTTLKNQPLLGHTQQSSDNLSSWQWD